VNAVELDVRRTKDDQLVVIHDEAVDKTTTGIGRVKDLTLDEIKSLKTEMGDAIPTLAEALDFLDWRVKILIELKELGLETKVLDAVRARDLVENVILISVHEAALRTVHDLDAAIETGLICVKHKKPIEMAVALGCRYLLKLYHFTNSKDVQKAHANKLKIVVWTVNKAEDVQAFVEKGVDGIASDRPDTLQGIPETR
jgi:glycerophosphoryl diester phosphodiesterase